MEGSGNPPLTRATRSTSEQINTKIRERAQTTRELNRRSINSMGIAELRRRRRSQLENSGTGPLPVNSLLPPSEETSPTTPRQIMCVGNYDLGRTIGRGKFGKVKIATHVLTGETVCLFSIFFWKVTETHYIF